MRYPQLVVYERDGRLAALLKPLADQYQVSLREPRRPNECLRLLMTGGPSVVVLRLSADRHAELAMLDRLSWLHLETWTIVVVEAESPALIGLAWDLGANCVLTPSQCREVLPDMVKRVLDPAERPEQRSRTDDDA